MKPGISALAWKKSSSDVVGRKRSEQDAIRKTRELCPCACVISVGTENVWGEFRMSKRLQGVELMDAPVTCVGVVRKPDNRKTNQEIILGVGD